MEKLYDVLPGFDWVAGARVPETRQVRLTEKSAEFDLLQGRILLVRDAPDAALADAPTGNALSATSTVPAQRPARSR